MFFFFQGSGFAWLGVCICYNASTHFFILFFFYCYYYNTYKTTYTLTLTASYNYVLYLQVSFLQKKETVAQLLGFF